MIWNKSMGGFFKGSNPNPPRGFGRSVDIAKVATSQSAEGEAIGRIDVSLEKVDTSSES